ncbi:oxidoreductase [Halorubellus sp. PRR65]|uniref:oxidoreductase n=1 Tax=Halorubellus sp. PRR65 TaxID=3098148 RepID=UPI002B262D2E|nr:oxidoreductase [Halorubellus sp. PRR65]
MSGWSEADVPDCSGQTVVVTGANSGIGREATRALAARGATVVMAVRSTDRGRDAAEGIRDEIAARGTSTPGKLEVRECDLADLDSVASFVDDVREAYDELDVLANNAGVMAVPYSETAQGFETQFGVNHVGHFALTEGLLGLLAASDGEARVVTQSSGLHENGDIDFDRVRPRSADPADDPERGYDEWAAYGQSKLANVLFARELDARLDDAGVADVTSVAVHPGYAATNLQKRGPEQRGSVLRKYAMEVANAVVAQSAADGALPLLYAATASDVAGGAYYGPGGLMNMRGSPERQEPSARALDDDLARRLWEASEEHTGISYDFDALAA